MRCGAYWLLDELAGILFLTAEMTGWLPRGVFGYASRSNNVRVLPDVSPVGEPLHEQNYVRWFVKRAATCSAVGWTMRFVKETGIDTRRRRRPARTRSAGRFDWTSDWRGLCRGSRTRSHDRATVDSATPRMRWRTVGCGTRVAWRPARPDCRFPLAPAIEPPDGLLQKEEVPLSGEGVGRHVHLTGCATTPAPKKLINRRCSRLPGGNRSGDQGGGNRDPVRKSFRISRFPPGGSDMPWFVAQEYHLHPLPVS